MTTIDKGAAGSWQMENRWENMGNGKFDYGFAVDWMRKDLDIAFEPKRARTRPACRSRRWSTSSIPRSRRWAAAAGTPRP